MENIFIILYSHDSGTVWGLNEAAVLNIHSTKSCLGLWSGILAIPGRSRSCPNLWLSSLEWGDDVETPILEAVRRPRAPLGDRYSWI